MRALGYILALFLIAVGMGDVSSFVDPSALVLGLSVIFVDTASLVVVLGLTIAGHPLLVAKRRRAYGPFFRLLPTAKPCSWASPPASAASPWP